MDPSTPRVVTLVLCTRDGQLLGVLPSFEVPRPWWSEVREVVETARERYGVDITVLRRLETGEVGVQPGGPITYLAEVTTPPSVRLGVWNRADPVAEVPHRLQWARPGGPAADLAWADEALARLGRPRTRSAVQIRSWNLSSIWRLPTASGAAWLKVVPPYFAHEGDILARLDAAAVPPLLAHDGQRVLLDEVPGEDQNGAPRPMLLRMVTMLVALQAGWVTGVGELLEIGLPDWRHPVLAERIAAVLARTSGELDAKTCTAIETLLAGMDQRYADVAACGIPDTLVHGDFHPGNVRGTNDRLVLLDWGDCGIGQPLLDQAAFLDRIRADDRAAVGAHWTAEWRAAVPGSDPARAAELLEPVGAMRQAVIYRTFLDGIEPDEHIYHRDDPALWLRRAAAADVPGAT